MKKFILFLFLILSTLVYTNSKFDYDKFVGYYSENEPVDKEVPHLPIYEIRKKRGNYILIDLTFMQSSDYSGKTPYFNLTKKNGVLYDKNNLTHTLKNDNLYIEWSGGNIEKYRKSDQLEINELLKYDNYKHLKMYDGDLIEF